MKEFYLKKNRNNDGILFFFRNKNESSIPKKKWIEKIEQNINYRDSKTTFKELLIFLDIKSKIEHKLDDVIITVWRGEEYKVTKIKMENKIEKLENLNFTISRDDYIQTETEIYIINKNNNLNGTI